MYHVAVLTTADVGNVPHGPDDVSAHASSLRHWCTVFRPVGDISNISCRKNCNVVRGTLVHRNFWDTLWKQENITVMEGDRPSSASGNDTLGFNVRIIKAKIRNEEVCDRMRRRNV
jgi:hypothetical protein